MEEKLSEGHGNYMENFKGSVENDLFPGALTNFRQEGHNKFYFESAFTILEVTVVSDLIFRFRYANNKYFENDFSYAFAKDFSPTAAEINLKEENDFYEIKTAQLRCQIFKEDLKKKILNK